VAAEEVVQQLKMISPLLPYSAEVEEVAVPAEPQEHLGKLFGELEDT
jgi:hypothetical protein